MGLCFLVSGIGNMYRYYKLIPIVTIEQDEFYFKDKMYLWNDIQSVEYDKRQKYGGSKLYFNTTTFIFKDGKSIHFFNNFYCNNSEAIDFIKQRIPVIPN